jgi:hypothetical protein
MLTGCYVGITAPPDPYTPDGAVIQASVDWAYHYPDEQEVRRLKDAIMQRLNAIDDPGVLGYGGLSVRTDDARTESPTVEIRSSATAVPAIRQAIERPGLPYSVAVTGVWTADGPQPQRTSAAVQGWAAGILYAFAPFVIAILVFARAFGGEPDRRLWWLLGVIVIPFWWLAVLFRFVVRSTPSQLLLIAGLVTSTLALWGIWLLGDEGTFALVGRNQSGGSAPSQLMPAFPFPRFPEDLVRPAGELFVVVGALATGLIVALAFLSRRRSGRPSSRPRPPLAPA